MKVICAWCLEEGKREGSTGGFRGDAGGLPGSQGAAQGWDGLHWDGQLPKLDVAGSIPVARSNDDAGLQGACSPAFAWMLPLCAPLHTVSPTLAMGSHA